MILSFYSLVVFFSFLDVCILYPITTPQFQGPPDKLKLSQKISKYVKKPGTLADSARQLCDEGKYKSAMKLFKKAIKKSRGKAQFYKMRGDCYRKMQTMESLVSAIADFRAAARGASHVIEYKVLLANALFENREYDEAMKETIQGGLNTLALVNLGDKLQAKEQFVRAITCYSEALDRTPEPKPAMYYYQRGLCHKKLGSLRDAANDLQQAIKGEPRDKNIQWHYTLTLLELGEKDEAFQVASGMDTPELTQLADQLYYELKFDEAIRYYSQLIVRDTDNAKAFERRGFCFWRKKELDTAISDYDEALRLNSSCTSCRLALIDIYCDQGKYVDAEAALEKLDISEVKPEDIERVQKAKNRIMEMRVLKVRKSLKEMVKSTSQLSLERSSLNTTLQTSNDNAADSDKRYPSEHDHQNTYLHWKRSQ